MARNGKIHIRFGKAMRVSFKIWQFRLIASIRRICEVEGVNSKLPDGQHFLMFDFDNVEEVKVEESLRYIQKQFKLPTIRIVSSGHTNCYHAYCFKRVSYPDMLKILASTPLLDPYSLKIAVLRGYSTLRFTSKKSERLALVSTLKSKVEEDVNPFKLCSFIKYETRRF